MAIGRNKVTTRRADARWHADLGVIYLLFRLDISRHWAAASW